MRFAAESNQSTRIRLSYLGFWANFSKLEWFLPVFVFLLVFIMAARTQLDSDLWWHLRAGEESWLSRQPILNDHMSFTMTGERWINHSWLAQVILFLVNKLTGDLGLGGLVAIIAASSMILVYFQMHGNPIIRGFLIVLASAVAAPVWSARPQLFTLLLFAGLAYLMHLFKWQRKDYLWLVVPLFLIWSNLHGGYVLGIIFMGLSILGEVLNKLVGISDEHTLSWKAIARLGWWTIVAWAVVMINPNGFSMWTIPFKTIGVEILRDSIDEWGSPDFHELAQQPFIWLLIGTVGALGFSRRKLEGTEFVLLAGFVYLALLSKRNFGPFALVAVPIMSRHISAMGFDLKNNFLTIFGSRWTRSPQDQQTNTRKFSPRVSSTLNMTLLILLLFAGALKLVMVTGPGVVENYKAQIFPVGAVRWLNANQPEGQLFNSYNWGGFLTWELRHYPVFVDGRTDLFDDEFLTTYIGIVSGEDGWERELDYYSINLVLVEPQAGLTVNLDNNPNWIIVYKDDISVLYTRTN